jgi:hypothetical protein
MHHIIKKKKEALSFRLLFQKKMSPAKLNYNIYDKKLLAIVIAFQKWRIYLKRFKYQIKVLTNYKNLTYFITIKALNRK